MYTFITNNWQSILVILILAVVLLLLYKFNKREIVRRIVLSLIVQAEKALGSGTGELKYAYVIDKFYTSLPGIIKILYTKKEIDAFITEGVDKLKELISKGINLNSYSDEVYINAINQGSTK